MWVMTTQQPLGTWTMTQRQLLPLTASFLSRLLICLISTLSHMPPSQQDDSGHTYVIWSVVSLGLYCQIAS